MPYFMREGSEAQRGEVTSPGSHCQEVAELGFEIWTVPTERLWPSPK